MPERRSPSPRDGMARFYIALHAALPAALLAAVLLHWFPPAGLEPLARRPAWTAWAAIGLWLLASALLGALARQASPLWRMALCAAAALLLLAGVSGWMQRAPLSLPVLAALSALALACAGLARCIGPGRVQAERAGRNAGSGPRGGSPGNAWPRRHRLRAALHAMARHLPFWLAGLLALESFRIAHLAAPGPDRPAGMLGLLLACLVVLPAATLRTWLPRTSATLWALAAGCHAGLAAKAGPLPWALAAGLCALAAVHAAWKTRA
ncbi:hypothetical protein [Acidovorax sacchari]|uniref:hypothetical protein n=1 Tax=Acidovorax sacchari TaxID=3230736 RepID=UPI0039E6C2BD